MTPYVHRGFDLRFRPPKGVTAMNSFGSPSAAVRYARSVSTVMTLDVVRSRRGEILAAAGRRRASRVRVFGSVARGDAGPDSDVDFLVDFDDEASLLDQVGLIQDLHELLGVGVDVVSSGGLRSRHDPIRDEAVEL